MYPLNSDPGNDLGEEISAGVDQNRESALVREGMDLAETHRRHESDDTDLSGTEWPDVYEEIDQDANVKGDIDIAPEIDAIHIEQIPESE